MTWRDGQRAELPEFFERSLCRNSRMNDLPMPSDLRAGAPLATPRGENPAQPAIEPPSVKLIVRLFVIPFLIVAAAVGIMMLIGAMAGGTPSVPGAITRLKRRGRARVADWL